MDTQKLLSLESIRGLAAFIVVLWHFMWAFFPAVVNGPAYAQHGGWNLLLYQTPLGVIFAGNFSVVIFFVLSGFVLTYRFMAGQQKSLFPAAIKRYVRLMPVVYVAIFIGYFLMAWGAIAGHAAGQLSGSQWLASEYFAFTPSFTDALYQALIGVFQSPASHGSYDPVLWTIYYELLGSFLIFGLASLARGHNRRWLLYLVAAVVFSGTYFVGFIVGLAIADTYANRRELFTRVGKLPLVYKLLALGAALAVAGYPSGIGAPADFGPYYKALTLFPNDVALSRTLLQLFAAIIIITLALGWARFGRLLERKPLVWLGKVSYSLYASHLVIIFSFSSALFVWFAHMWGYTIGAFAASGLGLVLILLVAAFLRRFVEGPSIELAQRVGLWSKG